MHAEHWAQKKKMKTKSKTGPRGPKGPKTKKHKNSQTNGKYLNKLIKFA